MSYKVDHCSIVVLAAGMSGRLGSPKQLLAYKGKSLLQHAISTALQTTMRPVVVVTGANSSAVKQEMEGMEIEIADNELWQEGMASSLRCGLTAIRKIDSNIDGVIFMVCDQPYVTGSLLGSLIQAQRETGLPIVACHYGVSLGTPVLFHREFFDELMKLQGDTGARNLIRQHQDQVTSVDFPEGSIDIDTQNDYQSLLKTK